MIKNETGRSMIEMLGVLAIIGVLSIGGIAGYSKAMSIYHLNQWKQSFRALMAELNNLYIGKGHFYGDAGERENILQTAELAGVVPDGFLDENDKDYYGNTLKVYTFKGDYDERLFFEFNLTGGDDSVNLCREIFTIANSNPQSYTMIFNQTVSYFCGPKSSAKYQKFCGGKKISDGIASISSYCRKFCYEKNCRLAYVIVSELY